MHIRRRLLVDFTWKKYGLGYYTYCKFRNLGRHIYAVEERRKHYEY